MCLAYPGKIIKIDDYVATVEYPQYTRTAKIYVGNFKVGDYVIVQAGIVIENIPEAQAKNWNKFLKKTKYNEN